MMSAYELGYQYGSTIFGILLGLLILLGYKSFQKMKAEDNNELQEVQ